MTRRGFGISILAGLSCLIFVAEPGPGGAASVQKPGVRRDARDPQNIRVKQTGSLNRRLDGSRRRRALASTTWAYAFQGDREDEARGVFSTSDGGVIFWGDTRILGGASQAWMTKLSQQGAVEWSRVYLSGNILIFSEVTRTADGGFVAAGSMASNGTSAVVVKISATGLVEWGCQFGSEMGDKADSVQQTADGGFIVAGVTNAFITNDSGDFWVSKLTASGDVEWSYVLRGTGDESDWANGTRNLTVRQSADGGYYLAGDSDSFGAGWRDIWIFKLTSLGGIEWQRTYGGAGDETFPNSGPHFVTTPDGGLIVACTTASFGSLGGDGWLFQVSSSGDIAWQKRVGGTQPDTFNTIQPTSDGGYVLGGITKSSPDEEYSQAWVLKLDSAMAIQWQYAYGTNTRFDVQGVDQATDGGYAAGGCTNGSSNYWYWDANRDAFVMKIDENGKVGPPASDFIAESAAVSADTDATAQETSISPLPGFGTSSPLSVGSLGVVPQEELLSWGGIQPPLDLTLTRETNRGLFKGEAVNTLQWSPNPWNSTYNLVAYAVYRRPLDAGGSAFQKIATVPANALAYVEQHLGLTEKYSYLLKSIDAEGNESPATKIVRN